MNKQIDTVQGLQWAAGALLILLLFYTGIAWAEDPPIRIQRDLAVPMRDGTVLRADLFLPTDPGRYPVLIYRSPYNKEEEEAAYSTHLNAARHGYAVLIQDVRGRYASEGEFDPYRNEGRDGYDTIEWAAKQPWSNGAVGTYGLSYPGAVQWLAALESPPHLKAMAPAMTYSSPRDFFYFDGIFDLSWIEWIHFNIAPEQRRRLDLPGPRTAQDVAAAWKADADRMRRHLPLISLPDLSEVAPFYYAWLEHPPEDPWWDPLEVRGRYGQVQAAVLNLSGWYDEGYGPEGAVTNFRGLMQARAGEQDPRTFLVMGPWQHGVQETGTGRTGELDFGADAGIDYDVLLLRFFDHYLRGENNGFGREPRVRYFVMGRNTWRTSVQWPPRRVTGRNYYFAGGAPGIPGRLQMDRVQEEVAQSRFVSDPDDPVLDLYESYGPHDYSKLTGRRDLLVYDTKPFETQTEFTGPILADLYVSCNCRDLDLWVRLFRVDRTGRAWNLMSPSLDAMRASYRVPDHPQMLESGTIYRLQLTRMVTSQAFSMGERLRASISGSFFPRLSRNLQTGRSERVSEDIQAAEITIHQGRDHPSRLLLPLMPAPAEPTPLTGHTGESTKSRP